MRRKIIVLLISIIVPIIGAVTLGLYDYKVWYNPNGSNASTLHATYKTYVSTSLLEVTANEEDFKGQTEERIDLFRLFHSYYYTQEPIYEKDVIVGGKKLFTIIIFENIVLYTPSADVDPVNRIRYEIYIYDVNYKALTDLFMDSTVLPSDKKVVENAGYPVLLINFFPNDTYKEEAAIYTSVSGGGYIYTLYNGKTIYGSKLNSPTSYSLFDYGSNPRYTEDDAPHAVQYLGFNDYTAPVNIDDSNNGTEDTERNRFADGAYVKVDAILVSDQMYSYKSGLLKDKVEEMDFSINDINLDKYASGFEDNITNIKIPKVMTYNQWVFAKYVWWQCLLAMFIIGLIMTGFYFTFTYEEKPVKKVVKKKK